MASQSLEANLDRHAEVDLELPADCPLPRVTWVAEAIQTPNGDLEPGHKRRLTQALPGGKVLATYTVEQLDWLMAWERVWNGDQVAPPAINPRSG